MKLLQEFDGQLNDKLISLFKNYILDPQTPFNTLQLAYIDKKIPTISTEPLIKSLKDTFENDLLDFKSCLHRSIYIQQKNEDQTNSQKDEQSLKRDDTTKTRLIGEIEQLNISIKDIERKLQTNKSEIEYLYNQSKQNETAFEKDLSPLMQLKYEQESSHSIIERQLNRCSSNYESKKTQLNFTIQQTKRDIRNTEDHIEEKKRKVTRLEEQKRELRRRDDHIHHDGFGSNHFSHRFDSTHHSHHQNQHVHVPHIHLSHNSFNTSFSDASRIDNEISSLEREIREHNSRLIELNAKVRTQQYELSEQQRQTYQEEARARSELRESTNRLDEINSKIAQLKTEEEYKKTAITHQHSKFKLLNDSLRCSINEKSESVSLKNKEVLNIDMRKIELNARNTQRHKREQLFEQHLNQMGSTEGLTTELKNKYQDELNKGNGAAIKLKNSIEQKIQDSSYSVFRTQLESTSFADEKKQKALSTMIEALHTYEHDTVLIEQQEQQLQQTIQHIKQGYLSQYNTFALEQQKNLESQLQKLDEEHNSQLSGLSEKQQLAQKKLSDQFVIASQNAIDLYNQKLLETINQYNSIHFFDVQRNNRFTDENNLKMTTINEALAQTQALLSSNQYLLVAHEKWLFDILDTTQRLQADINKRTQNVVNRDFLFKWIGIGLSLIAVSALVSALILIELGLLFVSIFPLVALGISLLLLTASVVIYVGLSLKDNSTIENNSDLISKNDAEVNKYTDETKPNLTAEIAKNSAHESQLNAQKMEIQNNLDQARAILDSIEQNHPSNDPKTKALKGNEVIIEQHSKALADLEQSFTDIVTLLKEQLEITKQLKKSDLDTAIKQAQSKANNEFEPQDQKTIEQLELELKQTKQRAKQAITNAHAVTYTSEAIVSTSSIRSRPNSPLLFNDQTQTTDSSLSNTCGNSNQY